MEGVAFLRRRSLLGLGGLLLGLAGLAQVSFGQPVPTDAATDAKLGQHPQLKGEARYRSARELADRLEKHMQRSGFDARLPQIYSYLHQALALGRQHSRADWQSEALQELARYHHRWNDADSLNVALAQIKQLAHRPPQGLNRCRMKYVETLVADVRNDSANTLRHCLELIELVRRERLSDWETTSRQNTIDLANKYGNHPLSILQERHLIEFDIKQGDYSSAGSRYEGLSHLYDQLNERDSAQLMIREAFRWHLRSPNRQDYGGFLLRLGNYYLAANNFAKAIPCYYVSQAILDSVSHARKQEGDDDYPQCVFDVAVVRGNLAAAYLAVSQLDSSAYWLHRAQHPMRLMANSSLDIYINFQLASIYYKQNRADSALIRIDSAHRALKPYNPEHPVMPFSVATLRGTIHRSYGHATQGREDLLRAYTYFEDIRQGLP